MHNLSDCSHVGLNGFNSDTLTGGGGTRSLTFDPTVTVIDSTDQGGGGTNSPPSLVSFNDVKFIWKSIEWENGEHSSASFDFKVSIASEIIVFPFGRDFSGGSHLPVQMEILPTDALEIPCSVRDSEFLCLRVPLFV